MSHSFPRRNFLTRLSLAVAAAFSAPLNAFSNTIRELEPDPTEASGHILKIRRLGFQWETSDPFLFCAHHEDRFPKGNAECGPPSSMLAGRSMGDDFIIKDGFRMYHGKRVPGFPGHPHRGFETITVVRQGLVDHADSMGASGRYGNGDVQWMTAGKGVQHSEMFPLLKQDEENPLELFQIWLNLPAKRKMVKPYFKMLWADQIPHARFTDNNGKNIVVEVIAGKVGKYKAATPPPDSWAADPANEVAVLHIMLDAGAAWTLPAASAGINRTLFYYEGEGLYLAGQAIPAYHAIELQANAEIKLKAGKTPSSLLLLQGKPIGEPVIQYGPFVMNTKEEIMQAFEDYNKDQFGGWPWPRFDQVHPRSKSRFARHADGKEEIKNS